jgi:hypothetical protein
LNQALFIKVNGNNRNVMGKDNNTGAMVQSTKDIGKKTWPTARDV